MTNAEIRQLIEQRKAEIARIVAVREAFLRDHGSTMIATGTPESAIARLNGNAR